MKKLVTNYFVLDQLSLADEIALLQFEASVLDGILQEILKLEEKQHVIPLDILESKRLRELKEEDPKLRQIISVLNNWVSNVLNSIFSWEDPESDKISPNKKE